VSDIGVHFIRVSSSAALTSELCGESARSSYIFAENRCCCERPGDPARTCCAQACLRDAVNDSTAGAHYTDIRL
jgi:hypothetical protein